MQIVSKIRAAANTAIDTEPLCKALIIDDDTEFTGELIELLEGLGYTAIARPSAFEGLAEMAADPDIGIVLCDYKLPDMVGLDLAREIARIHSRDRAFAFILISGFANLDLALEALRVGVDDFLTKPIKPGELARAFRDGTEIFRIRSRALAEQPEQPRQRSSEPLMLGSAQRDPLASAQAMASLITQRPPGSAKIDDWGVAANDLLDLLLLVHRERERLLHQSIFGDPAWEISLELLKRGLRNEAIPVSSACTASCAPLTTSLRWVRNMEKLGLVERWNDPKDKRRDLLRLSESYLDEMNRLLRSAVRKWASGDFL